MLKTIIRLQLILFIAFQLFSLCGANEFNCDCDGNLIGINNEVCLGCFCCDSNLNLSPSSTFSKEFSSFDSIRTNQISFSIGNLKLHEEISISFSAKNDNNQNPIIRLQIKDNQITILKSSSHVESSIQLDELEIDQNKFTFTFIPISARLWNYSFSISEFSLHSDTLEMPDSIISLNIDHSKEISVSNLKICSFSSPQFEKRQIGCTPSFVPLGTGANSGSVFAISSLGNDIYIGGTFLQVGSITVNNIARWNGTSWSALGNSTTNGTNGAVFALASLFNRLYVGGSFLVAGGITMNRLAVWNGTNWLSLGANVSQPSFYIKALRANGLALYIGGYFTDIGGVLASNVARFLGGVFIALGAGVNGSVNAIEVMSTDVYFAGTFTNAGGIAANRIAKWNGTWNALSTGANNNVNALAIISNELYIGGIYGNAGGVTDSGRITRWNGANWFALNTGISDEVYALSAVGNELYVGGSFLTASGVTAMRIAKWNGTWNAVGDGMDNFVYSFHYLSNWLYIGGSFTNVNGTAGINRIVKYGGCMPPTPAPTPAPSTSETVPETTPAPETTIGVATTPVPTPIPTPTTPPQATPQPTPISTSQPTPISPLQPTPIPTPQNNFPQDTGNSIDSSSVKDSTTLPIIIGVVVGVVVLLICVIIVLVMVIVKGRKQKNSQQSQDIALQTKDQNLRSVYADIVSVTPNPNEQYNTPYVKSELLTTNNNSSQYVSSTTILENTTTKIEARELFRKFAIPYSELILEKEVGKGNFGSVYLAHRKSDVSRSIACKQIEAKPSNDTYASTASDALKKETKAFKDFIAEAKVLQSIPPSDYVVRFIGLCSEPFCILTEFIDGGSLLDFLTSAGNGYNFKIAIGFLKQICKGIAHLHKNGIIHRDLAARNVLLRKKIDEETGVRQCVLVDMGLARLFDTGEDYLKTKSQIPLKWTAPEALRDRKFSEKSDMYSFGILAIECFTREKPFPQMTALECAMAIATARLIPSVKGVCPDALVPIFDSCFSLNTEERPTANDMIVSLSNFQF